MGDKFGVRTELLSERKNLTSRDTTTSTSSLTASSLPVLPIRSTDLGHSLSSPLSTLPSKRTKRTSDHSMLSAAKPTLSTDPSPRRLLEAMPSAISEESHLLTRAFRKDFVNDVIIGEKTFGRFSDFPTDVQSSNGVIHS